MSCTVILLDVGPSMGSIPDNGDPSKLDSAITAIEWYLKDLMFENKKDEVALVLFGTEETNNPMADKDPNFYQHIELVSEMALPGLDLMRYLHNSVVPSVAEEDEACFFDAMMVFLEHLVTSTAHKTGKAAQAAKNLIIFTDGGMPFNASGQLDMIVENCNNENIGVQVVGFKDPDENDLDDDDADDSEGDEGGGASAIVAVKPEVEDALVRDVAKAAEILNYIAKKTAKDDGGIMTFDEALEHLGSYKKRRINQVTTFRGPLEIGALQIPVYVYIRQQSGKTLTISKKVSPEVEVDPKDHSTGEVESRRTLHLDDDDKTEVQPEDTIKGVRYGNQFYPWDDLNEDEFKVETTKKMQVVQFAPKGSIPRHHLTGSKIISVTHPPADETGAKALSALCHALEDSGTVAIARCIWRKNASPLLFMLWPHIKDGYEALLGAKIPYKEEMTTIHAPSLATNASQQPSAEQLSAMDAFVDSMNLISRDGDEEAKEALQPKTLFNPHRLRQMQCVVQRALEPESPLPAMDAKIAKHAMGDLDGLMQKAEASITALAAQFPLRRIEKGKDTSKLRSWEQQSEAADSAPKRIKAEADSGPLNMSALLEAAVVSVGSVTPVQDYKTLCDSKTADNLGSATKQLQKLVNDAMMLYLGGSTGSFTKMLQVMREYCLKGKEPALFNDFIAELRNTITTQMDARQPFWAQITEHSIMPITTDECVASAVSTDEAKQFLKFEEKKAEAAATAADESEDEEDMLDDL